MFQIEIVNSDVDSETEDYQSTITKNEIKKIDNAKKLNLTESVSQPIQLKTGDETENYIIFEQSIQFGGYFGYILGININFDWKPNPKYYITVFALVFMWSQIFYTQFLYIKNKEYYKLLEVFACYGITLSVIKSELLNLIHAISYKLQ